MVWGTDRTAPNTVGIKVIAAVPALKVEITVTLSPLLIPRRQQSDQLITHY
jgi:hypothetical protein